MFQGLDHVYQAVRVLAVRNARINQRLFEAADQFSRALDRPDQWPGDLLGRAAAIHQKLTARGKPGERRIDTTIAGMDVSVAERLAGEMLDLAMDIRAAQNRQAQNRQAELSGPINASRRQSRRTQSRRTLMSRS